MENLNLNVDEVLNTKFDEENCDEYILNFFKILYKLNFHRARELKKEFRLHNLNAFQIQNLESADREDLFVELQTSILENLEKNSDQKSV